MGKLCKEMKVVSVINDSMHVMYGRFQTSAFCRGGGRDFCCLRYVSELEDGTIVIIYTSIEHPGCPPHTNCVRGDLRCYGWIITPTGNGGSNITSMLEVDLRGGISDKTVEHVGKKVPSIIRHLRANLPHPQSNSRPSL